ncbi:MAG: DUF2085 domain-containing protein [Promethearchaeota archaeon]|nr:MAG: DUF2085 domain-containing protein [Candidatus Lokiarchaeota archaeon]
MREHPNQKQEKVEQTINSSKIIKFDNLREIFLPLFILIFIIITYFYFSEAFGSISSIYVQESSFSLHFGVTLLIFVFFSFLAGPYQGFFGGLLGEFFYQLAFYDIIYFEWILIIGILGLLSGIYKYKPLKYADGIKIYYTFLSILISSSIVSGLIILFNIILPPSLSLKVIVIDYGFKFFFESFLSIVFVVPILLVLYDRILAKQERYVYEIFLTHHPIYQSDHTFHLKFGRTYFYFCSRCSGVLVGAFISAFFMDVFQKAFEFTLVSELAVILCILLPIPSVIDWGTQSFGIRSSNTPLRLFTGFFLGMGLNYLVYTRQYYFFMLIIVAFYFFLVALLMYLGKRRTSKDYNDDNKIPIDKEEFYE